TPSDAGAAMVRADSGYRVSDASGTVVAFGSKNVASSFLTRANGEVVGMTSTPSGRGYWLAGACGGVFAYGDARYFGSMSRGRMRAPLVGIAATRTGRGYWLAAADSGVFAFGDARYYGAATRSRMRTPIAGI